jgi:hypothetical protein
VFKYLFSLCQKQKKAPIFSLIFITLFTLVAKKIKDKKKFETFHLGHEIWCF